MAEVTATEASGEAVQNRGVENKTKSLPPGLEIYATTPFDGSAFRASMSDAQLSTEQDLAHAAIVHDNLLGRGGNGRVYKIPRIDGYVIKVPGVSESRDVNIDTLEPIDDPFPNLNVGQAVATMGEGLLLKAQTGIPAGGSIGKERYTPEKIARYEHGLQVAASMDPSAYAAYALLLEYLHENGYATDASKANNILMDRTQGVFNVVDLIKPEDVSRNNTVADMAVPIVDNAYANGLQSADTEAFERTKEARKIILTKVLEAGREKGLPLPDEEFSGFHYTLELAGMSEESTKIKEETTRHEREDAAQLADVREAIRDDVEKVAPQQREQPTPAETTPAIPVVSVKETDVDDVW